MTHAFSKVDITNFVNVLIEGHLHLKMAKVKQMQDVIEEQSEAWQEEHAHQGLNRVTTANKANGKRSPLGQALSGARFKSLHK